MTLQTEKPRQIPAVVSRCGEDTSNAIDIQPIETASLRIVRQERPSVGKRMPFTYSPGPISIILLKIKAMENYSGNADRLTRQREFCTRVKVS
jgi:hypothetical protein